MHHYKFKVLEQHLDTFGHVNNATYLTLLEEARWDWITYNGYSLHEIQKTKKGPVILEVNLKFRRELRLREEITINSEVIEWNGKLGRLKQQMLKPDGSLAAEAVFTVGFFDLMSRKLIDPDPQWMKAIDFKA